MEGYPGIFRVIDSTLVLLNVNIDPQYYLYNYDLQNHCLSKGYLSSGRGPHESIGAYMFGASQKNIWVYDLTMTKVFIQPLSSQHSQRSDKFCSYKCLNSYYMIDFVDSTHYLAVGNYESINKIEKVNLYNGNVIETYGNYSGKPHDIPFQAYKEANKCFIHCKPHGTKAVLSYLFTDKIEIFDLNRSYHKSIQGPLNFKAEYNIYNNKMLMNSKTRGAYTKGGGCVTTNYIYLLYSGNLVFKDNKPNSQHPTAIFVFDWDGNPIRKLTFDGNFDGIAVSEDDDTIFMYNRDTGYIMKAKL